MTTDNKSKLSLLAIPCGPLTPSKTHQYSALLNLALDAKNKGSGFADMALFQLSTLTGVHYEFQRVVMSGSALHTIVEV